MLGQFELSLDQQFDLRHPVEDGEMKLILLELRYCRGLSGPEVQALARLLEDMQEELKTLKRNADDLAADGADYGGRGIPMTGQTKAPERFTKKPVTITAIQWTGDNLKEVLDFTGKHPKWGEWFSDFAAYAARVKSDGNVFKILTLEGTMKALPGDWIIRGVNGEHYPCKPDIFSATYSPADIAAEQVREAREAILDAIAGIPHPDDLGEAEGLEKAYRAAEVAANMSAESVRSIKVKGNEAYERGLTDALAIAKAEHDQWRFGQDFAPDAVARLVEAARAIGAMPEGYCFCSANRVGDDSKIHEPECADLRAALVAKEHEQCQISIGPATGATINGLHGSGAGAPDAVDNSHTDAVARLVKAAWSEAQRALTKYPQPNYVITKLAEEAGEVVKAAIHCIEGRETAEAVIGEITQAMAMLMRLYVEGDQVHGPPALAAMETNHAS